MTASVSGKTAIVTGSSRGIGKAVALKLAREGFAVTVNYFSRTEDAAQVVAQIEEAGGRALAVKADVADAAQADRLFEETVRAFGGVDALVNNAGAIVLKPAAEMSEEDFDRVIRANVKGTFNMLQLAARGLRQGGSVVNVSTSALTTSMPGYVAYNASKAAVEAMTRVLAKELAPRGITVNAVAPGPVATELFYKDKSQEIIDRLIKMTPLSRLGEVEDIAPVVAFLISPEAKWITGQVLRVNGGLG